MLILVFRFITVYFFMIFSMKLMGKRQVGEMQMSELITAFFLSELATCTVTDLDLPLIFGILPILIMICLEVIVSYFAVKIPKVKKAVDFSPSILINHGKVMESELEKNRVTLDELLSLLRIGGCFDIRKVNFAILEPNGQLSVIPYEKNESPTREEMGIPVKDGAFTVAVVEDGKINRKALDAIEKDEKWLSGQLKKYRVNTIDEVFLLTSDFLGQTFFVKKEHQ